ncbi:aminoglycoside 6-adenylyltransferase [Metabacillus sp. 113a]|uniref:aminoglycoside 6-adenylyltransferase n=1 Tax=Metabacillus sp. 113a TaxID=3404706 RepID=UPI003CEEB34B
MRSENQVLHQIVEFAMGESMVRAVMMNGSRLNSNAPKDFLQDYDLVFFVNDLPSARYKRNQDWIRQFGELVIMQQNDFDDGAYIFLMLFKDGVRIDLCFKDAAVIHKSVNEDSLTRILLDKDHCLPELSPPDDSSYYVKKPSEMEYKNCLNEAWWIQTYTAKGLLRNEWPYARYMYDTIIIPCVHSILSWVIGYEHEWRVNIGVSGRWLNRYLSPGQYEKLQSLYVNSDKERQWDCLFKAGEVIREYGRKAAGNMGYEYPEREDKEVTAYLQNLRKKDLI